MQDRACPTSQSVVWSWVKEQYRTMRFEDWSDIPHQATASAWIADHYAAWIESIQKQHEKPVVILEWGAGSGGLAFRLLRRLSQHSHYLVCDLQPDMPSVLQAHPDLKPHLDSGRMRLCVWDFENSAHWLQMLSEWFDPEQYVFVMIFNYFFDSLPGDVWYAPASGAVEPVCMIVDAAGSLPWHKRRIDELRVRLESPGVHAVDESWYRHLLEHCQPFAEAGAMYHVPTHALRVFEAMRATLPVCHSVVCDIPLRRVPVSGPTSPYFVDGMLAGLVDFELIAQWCQYRGAEVHLDADLVGVELRMLSCAWGAPACRVVQHTPVSAYWWWLCAWRAEKRTTLAYTEACAALMLSHYDVMLLGDLVDAQAGCDVPHYERASWLNMLDRIAQDVYWMRGTLEYLHLATLYRWQKDFESALRLLLMHARREGYDARYWYCMGYWLYDQQRHHDAVDAWERIKDPQLTSWISEDLKEARRRAGSVG